MRILIFSTAYLPFVGGAELAIKEITDRIPRDEFSFDLITLNLDRKQLSHEQVGNVRVLRLSCPKLLFPMYAFIRARKLHCQTPYDRVWAIMASYGGFAGLFFKCHFPKVPFILTLQEGDSLSHIYKRVFFVWPLFKRIFTSADRITAISNYLADWARKMGATASIAVIPNGYSDLSWFDKNEIQPGNREVFKAKQGFKKDDKIVITTSRLVHKNAVDIIICALKELPSNVHLMILGDGQLHSELESLTKRLKISDRVHFKGQISNSRIIHFLNISDIFARPSRSEGMGTSFIEAMAAGLPVIATPVGGIPDFLQNGKTGLFCEVDNPKSIAEKVQLLLSDNKLRSHIIDNASKMVQEKYEWDGIARKMRDVLTYG